MSAHSSIQLHKDTASAFGSGFLAHLAECRPGDTSTLVIAATLSCEKRHLTTWRLPRTNPASVFQFRRLGAACDPPIDRGILVSRTPDGRAVISSVPAASL